MNYKEKKKEAINSKYCHRGKTFISFPGSNLYLCVYVPHYGVGDAVFSTTVNKVNIWCWNRCENSNII